MESGRQRGATGWITALVVVLPFLFFGCSAVDPAANPAADSLAAARSSNGTDPILQLDPGMDTASTDTQRNPDLEPGPIPPITLQPAPLLTRSLVAALFDVNNELTTVAGTVGAAADGVTRILGLKPDGSPFELASNQDGSFTGLIDGVQPDDLLVLWGEGDGYLPGGQGINAIEVRVTKRGYSSGCLVNGCEMLPAD
ncbi:MAG: hypothetical protein V1798_00135 [Pseudomonadota bacterium]